MGTATAQRTMRTISAIRGPLFTGAVIAVGAVAVLVRDPTVAGHYPACPVKALTGFDCPGCGSMRGTAALLRGDVAAAVDFNVLLIPAALLVAWLWLGWLASSSGWFTFPELRPTRKVTVALITIWVVFAVARNFPAFPYLRA